MTSSKSSTDILLICYPDAARGQMRQMEHFRRKNTNQGLVLLLVPKNVVHNVMYIISDP